MEAKQTSLIDLLERIPQGARLVVEHDQFSSSSHPVGRLCHEAAAALKAALAQQDEPEAYGYASRLAVAIWEKHYKDTAPQWKPLDYLIGVLTQIDNMTSGLTRQAQQAEPAQEPVPAAVVGTQSDVWRGYNGKWAPPGEPIKMVQMLRDLPTGTLLYTAPPQRKPLTEEEIYKIYNELWRSTEAVDFARAIERAHGIGETK